METLKDIRRRVQAVRDTRKIVRAMKLVAAAKLRSTQTAALNGRDYAVDLHRTVERISRRLGPDAPQMWRRPKSINCMDTLVVTSDRGLCGGFNENLMRFVEDRHYEHESHNISVKLYVIGRKGWQYFHAKGYDVEQVPSDGGQEAAVSWVGNALIQRFLSGESAGSFVIFNRFVSSAKHEIVSWNLLPLYSSAWEKKKEVDYIFEPNRDLALDFFGSEMIMSTVRQAIVESAAAEQVARILAMAAATKNADDMLAHLISLYNRARQEEITAELMDIVGGAEAQRKAC